MLYCGNAHITARDYRATLGFRYIFSQSIDYGLIGEVDALEFISVIIGSRKKCGFNFKTRMQALAFYGKFAIESLLLHG